MQRVVLISIALFLFAFDASAGPGFPTDLAAQSAWLDGPEGAFRPHAGAVAGQTFHVDGAAGLDINPGTEQEPFQTIARALEAVGGGDTIVVHAGLYHEQVKPPALSSPATRANPLHLLAEPADGASVVLDGTGVVGELEGLLENPAGMSFYSDSSFIIEGFSIRNWAGYGMAIAQSTDVQVIGCSFADNGTEMNFAADLILLGCRDARIFGNRFDSSTEMALIDKGIDSWIGHNTFSGHTNSAIKIGPEPEGLGSRVEHNLFYDNPATQGVILAREVRGVSVRRNLVVRGNLIGIGVDDAVGSDFVLNTVVGFHAGVQLRNLDGCRVEGNVLADNTMGMELLSLYMPDTTVDHNLYSGNVADVEGGDPGPNDVFADPGFVDPGNDDYSLAAGAAALDVGPADLPVPEGGGDRVDAGAFERGAAVPFWDYQPVGAVADRTPTFAWAYTDTDPAGVQGARRIQVDQVPWFDSAALIDSNWLAGDETAWTVPHDLELSEGAWYVRVKTRDENGADGPWSDPHLAFTVSAAPACGSQAGTTCQALDACQGDWLPAGDTDRCCLGSCVACPDVDGDGHLDAACGGADCDDEDPLVHPGAEEICDNGLDDDCDGAADLGDADCGCVDHDQDGYGENCEAGADCDDSVASIHPGAVEECNYADDDCDGDVDEGFDTDTDPDNCGECFWACRDLEVCDLGACADTCGGGRTECDRACVDTTEDLANCGGCGVACDLPNATERCSAGVCTLTLCEAGWVDGNAVPTDGCEYQCTPSGDGLEVCDNGQDDNCDGQVDEGCEGGGGGGCGCGPAPGAAGGLWLLLLWAVWGRRRPSPRA